jgi:hypothetical protein
MITRELTNQPDQNVGEVFRRPHIQKILRETYQMNDHEIAHLEMMIKKQCDQIISRQKRQETPGLSKRSTIH